MPLLISLSSLCLQHNASLWLIFQPRVGVFSTHTAYKDISSLVCVFIFAQHAFNCKVTANYNTNYVKSQLVPYCTLVIFILAHSVLLFLKQSPATHASYRHRPNYTESVLVWCGVTTSLQNSLSTA